MRGATEKWTPTSSLVTWGLLSLAVLVVAFAGLGSYSTLGTHEVLAAVPGREMLHSGDWIVPRYGDVPRLRKPPLVYWLVASSGWVFGEFSEFTARFHSALAAVGLVALMSLWAGRWYGREAAFSAVLVQTTSLWSVKFGRHAEVDLVLCLLTTAAMFLIATQPAEENSGQARWRWIGILTLIGLSWLAKFHYGMAIVFGPVFLYWSIQRRWRSGLNLVNPVGLLILLACVVVWPALLLREVPEALDCWLFETVGRATGQLGTDPWWFYAPEFALLSLPWIVHVLLAVPSSWQRAWRHGDERERFLWIWLLVDFGLLSLSPNKHTNYLLGVMPVATLLASQTIARVLGRLHRETLPIPRRTLQTASAVVVVALITGAAIVGEKWPDSRSGVTMIAGIGVCGAIAIARCWWLGHWRLAGWGGLVLGVVLFAIFVSDVSPHLDRRRITADFAQQVRRAVSGDQPVCVYVRRGTLPGFHPSIFYLGEPVYQVATLAELSQQVRQRGSLWAVVDGDCLPRLRAVNGSIELSEVARLSLPRGSREVPLACVRLSSSRVREFAAVSDGSTNGRSAAADARAGSEESGMVQGPLTSATSGHYTSSPPR